MSDKKGDDLGVTRRSLLGTTAKLATLAGASGAVGAAGMTALIGAHPARAQGKNKYEVAPGDFDEYYGFWSGGQSGEVRILGIPSMRELMRIPVFHRCSASGYGQTNESRKVLTEGLLPATKKYLES